jgi:hypothetical protein
MKKLNSFGASVKEGKNLDVLKKVRAWFRSEKNTDIISYYYSFDVSSRDEAWLRASDYKKCEICSRELYKKSGSKVSQMKHLIFIDTNGKERYTCGGVNWCLKRAGFTSKVSGGINVQEMDFFSFHGIESGTTLASDDESLKEIEGRYNRFVVPFVKKWAYVDVNKMNVLDFYDDLTSLRDSYLIYYEDRASSLVMKKILKLIGVYDG